jgi:hypothetical protein
MALMLLSPLMLSPIVMGFQLRAVDEREIFKMFLTRGLIYIFFLWSLLWVRKTKTILFYKKKIVGMVATCCQIAYEPHISKQINHSNTQGTKHTY